MRTVTLPSEDYFGLLEVGETLRTTIKGNSMLPFIVGERDVVTLKRAEPERVQVGDIVVVQQSHRHYFMHRVVKIQGEVIILRGDGNVKQQEICQKRDILAEAVAVEKSGKYYDKKSLLWRMAKHWWPSNAWMRRVCLAIYKRSSKKVEQ